MEITGMISPDPMDIFNQQMAGLCALQSPWKKVKLEPKKPIKIAPNTRRTLVTLAVIGMGNGLAEMIFDQSQGKKVLPRYAKNLNRVCMDAIDYWGRIDLREGKNLKIPKGIAHVDTVWKEHRKSVLVFTAMLIPMVADCAVEMKQAKNPDIRKVAFLEEIEAALIKIYRYFEQRGKANAEHVQYAEGLYREWLRVTA